MGHKITILVSITIAIFILLASSAFAQVGIGTTNPDTTAGLDVNFTDKGFLPPRMTTAQRNAILNPADGLMIFNITTGCHNYFYINSWYECCGIISPSGIIGSLDCVNANITGSLMQGEPANGTSASVPYNVGNGQYHGGQIVNSTGVNGLTATLSPGIFNIGSGNLTYSFTGIPIGSGTAIFALNIGGQNCILEIVISIPPFTCGTSKVTFNYNGSQVTYGTVVSANNECWLDRNLGATQVATSSDDPSAYGDLYQWGRLADGHQSKTSPITTILSNTDVPGHGNFITVQEFPFDWRSPQNENLWQGLTGINNPCPEGFRIPSQPEWNVELNSWSPQNAEGAFASPLKLTKAGYRNRYDGTIEFLGSYGYYWSSFFTEFGARELFFGSTVASFGDYYRALGMSVRCIKD